MKKSTRKDGEMRNQYDFTGGVRGKYARRYAEGTNVVVLDPDVARMFPNRQAVNETLRAVAQIVQIQERRRDGIKKGVHATAARALVGKIVSGLVRGRRVISSASRNQGIKTGKVITAFFVKGFFIERRRCSWDWPWR